MNKKIIQIARRVNWFEPPERVVADVDRFLTYFMQYCLDIDIPVMKKHYSHEQFKHAFENGAPGILDEKSRAYWELILYD